VNGPSTWRRQFAQYVAQAYIAEPALDAIFIGGSVARGHADKYSDAEIDVIWHEPPADDQRERVMRRIIADGKRARPFNPSEQLWTEDYFVGRAEPQAERSGLLIEIAGHALDQAQLILEDVLVRSDPDPIKQNFLSGIQQCIAIKGNELLAGWKQQTAIYPDPLARAVVLRHGQIDHFWRWRMWLDRNNRFMFNQQICDVQQRLLHMLLAVNRVYFSGFKWLQLVIAQFHHAPCDFAARFAQLSELPPDQAAESLRALVEETYDLVDQHVPGVPVAKFRSIFRWQRPQWDAQPPPVHPPKIL
jgi:hypothetical protein